MQRLITTAKDFFIGDSRATVGNAVIKIPPRDLTPIPQAKVSDSSVVVKRKDWRTHFANQLSGKGLEIGPLHRPMVKHDGMDIDYIDHLTVQELRENYPELADLDLVEPDIIGDAETLENIANQTYDFLIAAHVIEHTKNPISSIEQWCRVLKPGGRIYLIVPDKRFIFDFKRVRTTLEHLILDYRKPSVERDYEHYLEYAKFVHFQHGDKAFVEADKLVEQDYRIHFHVFIPEDIVKLLNWFSENVRPIRVVEGPVKNPREDEFHLLLELV